MGRVKIVEKVGNIWREKKVYRVPRMFDADYITTMGLDPITRIPFVRYQLLPAWIEGHRVNIVKHHVQVNYNEPKLEIPTDYYVCTRCKIMGNIETLKTYHCS